MALLLLVAFATWDDPGFLKPENLLNILRQCSFVGIVAVGMTFVIVLGGIDLSVGSLLAFLGGLGIIILNTVLQGTEVVGAAEAAGEAARLQAAAREAGEAVKPAWTRAMRDAPGLLREGLARLSVRSGMAGSEAWAAACAFACMLLAGGTAGLIHGLLVARGRMAPFIATLGGLAAYRSLALTMADGGEFRSESTVVFPYPGQEGIPIPGTDLSRGAAAADPLVVPWPAVAFLLVAVAGAVMLRRTRYGRYVYAVGCSERAARYAAVNVSRVQVLTYALVGLCTGLAALLQASRLNSVSSSGTGVLFELDVIAAVVIGGTSMRGGSGGVGGTVIGVLILAVIDNMLLRLDISPHLHGLVKGFIIVAAVLLHRSARRA